MRVFALLTGNIQSTLINSDATIVVVWSWHYYLHPGCTVVVSAQRTLVHQFWGGSKFDDSWWEFLLFWLVTSSQLSSTLTQHYYLHPGCTAVSVHQFWAGSKFDDSLLFWLVTSRLIQWTLINSDPTIPLTWPWHYYLHPGCTVVSVQCTLVHQFWGGSKFDDSWWEFLLFWLVTSSQLSSTLT